MYFAHLKSFWVHFTQYFGRNQTRQTRVFDRAQTRVYGFENGRVTRVFGYPGTRVSFPTPNQWRVITCLAVTVPWL